MNIQIFGMKKSFDTKKAERLGIFICWRNSTHCWLCPPLSSTQCSAAGRPSTPPQSMEEACLKPVTMHTAGLR